MLGLVVFGLRTWIWTTAAPALAASTQELAICSGVTGTAGFFPGESADPVTAHEMITLRCMAVTLPDETKAQACMEPQPRLARKPQLGTSAAVNHRPSSARLASLCALR